MKFVSALAYSNTYKQIFKVLQILLVIPPVLMIFILWRILKDNNVDASQLPVQVVWTFLAMIGVVGIMIFVFRMMLKYQSSYVVEITNSELFHYKPGREKHFTWQELKSAKVVRMNKGPQAIVVYWDGGKYMFHNYLIPEDKSTQQILSVIPIPKWRYLDGSSEMITMRNTYPYKLLLKFRPDLAESFKM